MKSNSIDRKKIESLLPHREPMLLIDRLINIAIPRIRDFRGLNPKSFDGNGNYSLGIKEQIVFPEINYDKIDKVRGLNITICTNAKSNQEALELLKSFNMPFPATENN